MNKIFSTNVFKIGIFISLIAGIFAVGFLMLPNVIHADACDTSYTEPIFNPYSVTWGNTAGCVGGVATDFAVISGGVHNSGVWSPNFSAQAGDSVTLMIYVHNGAASGSGAVMQGVKYDTAQSDSADGTSHTFSTTLSANNAASKTDSITINTPAGSTLQITSGNLSGTIGDMQPCFEFAQYFYVTLTVVAPTPPVTPPAPTAVFTINNQTSFPEPFYVGDARTQKVVTNMPNTTFAMCGFQTPPGGTSVCVQNWGTTDANGVWTYSDNLTESTIGDWIAYVQFPSRDNFQSNHLAFEVKAKEVTPPPVTPPAPTAHLTINDATTGSFTVGDTWTHRLTTNIPNTTFTMCGTQTPSGVPSCTPNWGTTDADGNWTTSGTFSSPDVGAWIEHVEFPSKNNFSSNQISFTVANVVVPPPVTPPAPTAVFTINNQTSFPEPFYVGDARTQKVVTNMPNTTFAMCGFQTPPGGTSVCVQNWGTTDANGVWTRSDTLDESTIGDWIAYVQFPSRDNFQSNHLAFEVKAREVVVTNIINPYCPDGGDLSYVNFVAAKNAGLISFNLTATNTPSYLATLHISNQTGCTVPISFSSYKVFGTVSVNQQLIDSAKVIATSSSVIQVKLSDCMSQIDWFYGAAPSALIPTIPSWSTSIFITGVLTNASQNPIVFGGWGNLPPGGFCPVPVNTADLAVTKTADKATANVGDTVTYTISLTNHGPDNATGVIVTDTLNSGLNFVSASASLGSYAMTTGVWTVGNLNNASSATLTIVATIKDISQGQEIPNTAVASSTTSDSNTNNNTSTVEVNVNEVIPPGCSTSLKATGSIVGANATLTVPEGACPMKVSFSSYSHQGTITPFEDQILIDNITDTYSPGTYNLGPLTLACNWQTDLYEGDVQTHLGPSGHLNLIASDYVEHQSCGTPNTDLAVVKTSDKATANVGDTVTYTISLTNHGPDNATGVTVADTLNSGLNFISATASQGSYTTTTGVWAVGNLNNASSATLTIVATIKDISQGQKIPNTAVASSTTADSNTDNNTSTVEVNVNPVVCTSNCGGGHTPNADLSISKTADKSTLSVGDTLTYIIKVINNGSDDATGVYVTDILPSELDLVSATSTLGSFSTSTGIWTIGNLSNSASTTLTLTATVKSGMEGKKITNTAITTATTADSNMANNTFSVEVTVNSPVVPPVNPPSGGGGGGGGSSSRSGGGHRQPVVTGEILGATSCYYLRDFLKIDWQNDPIEVLKLQSFLNVFEKENLSYTGVYNQETFDAVSRFQAKYSGDILLPWGPRVTSGFTYILTRKKVNEIYCNSPFPINQDQQNEILLFIGGGNPPDRTAAGQIVNNSISNNFSQSTTPVLDNNPILLGSSNVSNKVVSANAPVVNLVSSSSGSSVAVAKSVARNVAISLFALPQRILGDSSGSCSYSSILLLLILIALIIIIVRLFTNSRKAKIIPIVPVAPVAKVGNNEKKSPVIILPGVLPDEEIIIENPDEDIN